MDAGKLKEKLTLDNYKDIVKSLGGRIFSETDDKIVYYTNICHGGDSHKLYFYKETGMFVCYTGCGNFDIVSLVQRNKKIGFYQSMVYICNICGIPVEATERLTAKKDNVDDWKSMKKYLGHEQKFAKLTVFDKSVLKFLDNGYHESWLDFGISEEVMKAYHIGWYPYGNCITIPVFDREFNLVGIRVRNMIPETIDRGFKYMPLVTLGGVSYAFPTNSTLYGCQFNENAIIRTRKCLLVEAEKSVLKLATWLGLEDNNSLAMYGSTLSKKNRDYILSLGVDELVIVPDRDYMDYESEEYIKWDAKILKFFDMFKGYTKVSVAYDFEFRLGYKDNIVDGDYELFKYYYKEREMLE